jgi:hypothetical protein
MTVLRELSRYRLDLVGVQEVRWVGSGTVPAGNTHFSMERGMRTMNWVQGFFVHKRIISTVKRVFPLIVKKYATVATNMYSVPNMRSPVHIQCMQSRPLASGMQK